MSVAEVLKARLSQAAEPTRELLEEVWLAIHHSGYPPENEQDTCSLCDRFTAMLDAEAWTSAVEMLKPEDWWIQHLGECIGGWRCRIETNGPPSQSLTAGFSPHAPLPFPALALAIACLKARGL